MHGHDTTTEIWEYCDKDRLRCITFPYNPIICLDAIYDKCSGCSHCDKDKLTEYYEYTLNWNVEWWERTYGKEYKL